MVALHNKGINKNTSTDSMLVLKQKRQQQLMTMATDCKLCDSSCDFSDTRATFHSFVNQTPTGDTLGALNNDPRVIQWPLRNKRTTGRHSDRVLQNFDPPGHPQRRSRPNLNAVFLLQ
jgi:hypothetical protein